MNDIQNSLFEAMKAFRDSAMQNSNATVTVEGTITKIVDAGLGEYSIEYLDNNFIAYANPNVTYSVGDNVYILVPNGDFSKNKIIIGTMNPSAGVYVNTKSETSTHYRVSDNFITEDLGIIKMSSYGTTRVNNIAISQLNPENFADIVNRYADAGHRIFELNFSAYTKLVVDQQNSGNYGVALNLPIEANIAGGTTEVVWKTYTLDVGNMLGNPYHFEEWTPQSLYFELDEQYKLSDDYLPTISYFCYGFNQNPERVDIKDVWLKDIGVYVADALTAEDLEGYFLTIKATDGIYFTSDFTDPKTLSLVLKVNGKDTVLTEDNSEVYWFCEDAGIKSTDNNNYSLYGGLGWHCLNEKTNVIYNSDGTVDWNWITNKFTLTVSTTDIKSSLRYKCVVIYDGQQVSNIIELQNLLGEYKLELYSGTGSNIFLKDTGYVHLIEKVFIRTVTNQEENTNLVLYDWIRYNKNGEVINDNDSFFELVRFNEKIENYYETEIRFPVNTIEDLNYIYCTVKYNNDLIGTSSITISTVQNLDYNLIINGDNIIYKYDVNGDSPAGAAYDGPSTSKITSIAPLTYTIKKADGEELTKEEYCYVKYTWIVPKNSLFEVENFTRQDDNNYYFEGYDNLNHNVSLTYDIASRYNIAYANNTINLLIEYQDNVLSAIADIVFLKEGQSGTNGTRYAARLVCGGDSASTSVPYGTPAADGTLQKLKLCYDTVNNVLYRYKFVDEISEVDETALLPWSTNIKKIYTRVWRDGEELIYNTDFTVKYSMFDPVVCHPFFTVTQDSAGGATLALTSPIVDITTITPCSIVQAEIKVTSGNTSVTHSEEIIYAYYPIELVLTNLVTNLIPSLDGGFSEVMYASDGTNPSYDDTFPFEIKDNGLVVVDTDESLSDYYNINWTYQHHLNGTITGVIADLAPDNKYDDGNSCNYVKAALTLDSSAITTITTRIAELDALIDNYGQVVIPNITAKFTMLNNFARDYTVTTWLNTINSLESLLRAKGDYSYSLSVLNDYVNSFFDFLTNRSENFSDLLNRLTIIRQNISNLNIILGNLKDTAVFNDLFNLATNKIPWSDEVKTNYINTYGLDVTLQLQMLIENINNQIDVCDSDKNVLIANTNLTNFKTLYTNILSVFPYNTEDPNSYEKMFNNCRIFITNVFAFGAYKDFKSLFDDLYNKYLKGTFIYISITKTIQLSVAENMKLANELNRVQELMIQYAKEKRNLENIEDTVAITYIRPIVLYFNRYEMSNINAWDGNKIETGDGSYLLAPQVGSGVKETDPTTGSNLFTGIIIGQRNLDPVSRNSSDNQVGLFGYNKGEMSIFLNARKGSAIFGSAGSGGQIAIDPDSGYGMIYSMSIWDPNCIDVETGLPDAYTVNNLYEDPITEEGKGMLIDFTGKFNSNPNDPTTIKPKIFSKLHYELDSTKEGFYLDEDGLSIGSKFYVNAEDGSMRIGGGAVANEEDGHFWTIDIREDPNSEVGYESYIAFGGNERYDPERLGQQDYAKVYMGTDGFSISNKFSVDKDGNLVIGGGSVGGDSIGGWKIYNNYLASNNYEPGGTQGIKLDPMNNYISFGSSSGALFSGDHDSLNSDEDGFYLSQDGLSIGSNFKVTEEGELTATLGYIGGWVIGDGFLCSQNYLPDGDEGVSMFSEYGIFHFGSGTEGKIYSGAHDNVLSEEDGFYLGDDGLSINKYFCVNEDEVRIGNYLVKLDSRDASLYALEHSLNSWKLRSAAVNDAGDRYFTYLTKNKHLTVSNDAQSGHTADNDVADECTIGSQSYPWGNGYYKQLKLLTDTTYTEDSETGELKKHNHYCNVIPEGVPVTLEPGTAWKTSGNIYYQEVVINGITKPEPKKGKGQQVSIVPMEEFPENEDYNISNTYKYGISVYAIDKDKVIFFANTRPSEELRYYFLVEEYKDAVMNPAELWGHYEDDESTLYLAWDSPDDSSVFYTWKKDTVIIEKCIDEEEDLWEVVFDDVTITEQDKYIDIDDPLTIGPT